MQNAVTDNGQMSEIRCNNERRNQYRATEHGKQLGMQHCELYDNNVTFLNSWFRVCLEAEM